MAPVSFPPGEIRDLVGQFPGAAAALARLYRAYVAANASADAYANRLRADPMFSGLLHQILSQVTVVRSSAEILEDVGDLNEAERTRFVSSIGREARGLSDVAQTLIAQFDQSLVAHRALSPMREVDDLLLAEKNHFADLEQAADALRAEIGPGVPLGEVRLAAALERRFGVSVTRGGEQIFNSEGFPAQYHFDGPARRFWFQGATVAATRQFQMARLYAELAIPDLLNSLIADPRLTSSTARRLMYRALSSYAAGAIVFPYARFLEDAEAVRYDVDHLAQAYTGSFEQVAHRMVTLRRPGEEGIPFGFLRSDPSGRLTKQFPMPGLLLPNSGHACPLFAIYQSFRSPGLVVRQMARFADGGRYLFVAKAMAKRQATFREPPFLNAVMLVADRLNAERTVYAEGLDLSDEQGDVPVGPACHLCIRRECAHRQEEALTPAAEGRAERAPLVPRRFDLGG